MSQDYLFNNPFLMVGYVIEELPPAEKDTFKRYVVEAEVLQNGIMTKSRLPPCRVMSDFGSVADHSQWTPRLMEKKVTDDQPQDKEGKWDYGSMVLVMAINGNIYDCVIIGGYPHPNSKEDKTVSPNYETEFNGVNVSIDKDGQLTLTRKGATKADGEVDKDNDTKGGQTITLDKEGSLKVSTTKGFSIDLNDKDENVTVLTPKGNKIVLDDQNGKIDICSQGTINLIGNGASSASEALALASKTKQEIDAVRSALSDFMNHQHTGTATGISGAGTCSTTVTIPTPISPQPVKDVGSQTSITDS